MILSEFITCSQPRLDPAMRATHFRLDRFPTHMLRHGRFTRLINVPMTSRVVNTGNTLNMTTGRIQQLARHMSTSSSMAMAMASEEDEVLYQDRFGARIYTLNRPRALNALNIGMIHSLRQKIDVSTTAKGKQAIIGAQAERFVGRNGIPQTSAKSLWVQGTVIFALEETSKVM